MTFAVLVSHCIQQDSESKRPTPEATTCQVVLCVQMVCVHAYERQLIEATDYSQWGS